MATEGFKPVVAIYSTFLQRAYDQIVHDVCLDALPVIFAIDRGGIVGEDGPTHHGLFDFAYLRCLPNMVVMAPSDENELRRMLKTALAHPGPIALRYPRGTATGCELEPDPKPLEIGRAAVRRRGDDVLILAVGWTVQQAMIAAERLAGTGISATVVDARFVKPLDTETLVGLARRIPKIVTVEEHVLAGGFGSAVLECLAEHGLCGCRVKRLGVADTFVEHGPQKLLRGKYGIDADAIVAAVEGLPADA
jgi:1-deoxy-D-xylulose-5-phosphate synthase